MSIPVFKVGQRDFVEQVTALRGRLGRLQGITGTTEDEAGSPLASVREIIAAVRQRGDAALVEFTERFDGCRLSPDEFKVADDEIRSALERVPERLLEALRCVTERIRVFQEAILITEPDGVTEDGRELRLRVRPVDAAGIYVPGGSAPLASTVLMTAVPAAVAGVPRIVMATPPGGDGTVSDERLAAAGIAGVDEIYRLGGAQAIAALAHGTESVPRVDFIAGPGNVYVALAKRELFGRVGIDLIGGPSEVVVLADESADPRSVAIDLVAQAEHAPGSGILITDSASLADTVAEAVRAELAGLCADSPLARCLEQYGAIIGMDSMDDCVELVNELAPEHVEIIALDADALCERIRNAGAIFIGAYAPVAVGDYVAGPSHVLPTGATARFSSGLTANDFLRTSSIVRYERGALEADAGMICALAECERLAWHARSVRVRTVDGQAD